MTFDPSLDREPLSEDERAWLRDVELGRRSGLPSLSSKHVTDLSVSGLAFGDSWSQALVERVTFVGCQFAEHDFSAATFRGVTFERCKLKHCQYDATVV